MVVVLALLVVGGLYVAGAGPFHRPSGASPRDSQGQSYFQAALVAASAAAGESDGPWTVIGGYGLQIGTPVKLSPSDWNVTSSSGDCSGTLLPGANSIGAFPATLTTSASSGLSAGWVVEFRNSIGAVLNVGVFDGAATPVFESQDSAACALANTSETLPPDLIDSPEAAAVAIASGGGTFAAAHSSIDVEYVLNPASTGSVSAGSSPTPANWIVELTNCNEAAIGGATLDGEVPAEFIAEVNATSGELITTRNLIGACSQSSASTGGETTKPDFSATSYLAFSQQYEGPNYWNNGSLLITGSYSLTAANFSVEIENNTTNAEIATSGDTFEIDNGMTGAVEATYEFTTNTWSAPTIQVGGFHDDDVFVLLTTTSMAGDKIVFTATSSAPCVGSVSAVLGGLRRASPSVTDPLRHGNQFAVTFRKGWAVESL